ncbi:MAG: hypothetical protein FK731_01990 [Asgard group archaeon]|nr:hypothetical protein [Asgard group archaeon]
MKTLGNLMNNKNAAKSKKGIITSAVIAIVIVSIASFVFGGGGGTVIGIILSVLVLGAIGAGLFFWLKAVDDLPDAID